MISKCFENKFTISNICSYLSPMEIISFSLCNKTIYDQLNPSKNAFINNIMYCHISQTFFEFDEKESNSKKERQKFMRNLWRSSVNWKMYLNQISKLFKFYPDPDPEFGSKTSKFVLDSFKVHLHSLNLLQENTNLEFSYSTLHQLFYYDAISREIYKDKNYINDNDIINKRKNCKQIQIILRENLPFENELKNFNYVYDEWKNNQEYQIVFNNIINYEFEKLEKIYDNLEQNANNTKLNRIIYFILWVNKCLITHCIYTYETIVRYENSSDEKKFLVDSINQYDKYIKTSLLINSNYDNINLLMNYVKTYVMNNSDNSKKFSLYELSRKIYEKNVFDKISKKLIEKTSFLLKEYYEKKFDEESQNEENNKDKKQNENNDDDYQINFDELDEIIYTNDNTNDEAYDNKILIDKIISSVLDININKYNANAINHSEIKLLKEYETILNSKLCEIIQKKINEDENISKIYDFLEKSLKDEKINYFSFIPNQDSLKIINRTVNRTKKNLLQDTFKTISGFLLQKLIKDFSSRIRINNNERKLYIKGNEIRVDYKCDLTDFNQERIKKIEGKVQEEIKNIKTCLNERNKNGYNVNDTLKLVNEYIDNDGIEIVLFVKKMLYFYFKELESYEEKDQKVFNILTNKGNIGEN